MFYVKNVPGWERTLRVGAAAALMAYALIMQDGVMSTVLIASAAGLGLSGLFGFCPACAMVGRRLKK